MSNNKQTTKQNQIIYSIEGNIGSGKSTFIKLLREKYGDNKEFFFVDEPVKEWSQVKTKDGKNLIENFYQDMPRYSYIFQNFAYITRLKNLINAVETSNSTIIITERSVESDRHLFAKMLYEDGLLNQLEWEVYLSWFGILNINIDKFIYIKTSVDNCMKRIKLRNRDGEDNITREYIQSLHDKHEEWLLKKDNIIILNGNDNIFQNKVFENNIEIIDFEKHLSQSSSQCYPSQSSF